MDALNNESLRDRPEVTMFNALSSEDSVMSWSGDLWKEHRDFISTQLQMIGSDVKPKIDFTIREEIDYLCEQIADERSKPVAVRKLLTHSTSNSVFALAMGERWSYAHPARYLLNICAISYIVS